MPKPKKAAKPKKAKKAKQSEAEKKLIKEKGDHIAQIRSIFTKSGFSRLTGFADIELEFNGRKGDFDDAFIYQNLVLLLEYTVSKTDNISDHLLKKKILFDHVIENQTDFLDYLINKFDTFKVAFNNNDYTKDEIKLFIIYCSKNEVSETHKNQVNSILYLDFYSVKYFKSLTDIIRTSARFEVFKFLRLRYSDIGENISSSSGTGIDYKGSLLPHSYSNFTEGYKILSFYIDPKTLIERSYVLRKYGWLDDHGLYQRMIGAKKVSQIREYLNKENRVFINNIIVTLPADTKLLDNDKNTVDFRKVTRTQPVEIRLPKEYNSIGLIDGQHRVFAYHEGGIYEEKISKLREKQNLLVTGIVYPLNTIESDRTKFEAKLFLEINSNQANARSDLKQAIGLILKPFESIPRAVLESLNKKGPLERLFEVHYFDKGKLKTTSVVSYGLSALVKLSGTDSMFSLWSDTKKNELLKKDNEQLLQEYILFCTKEINNFLVAAKIELSQTNSWLITNRKEPKNVLNTTTINGFLICLRKLIEAKKTGNLEYYKQKLIGLTSIKFLEYKSSQYGDLGEEIYRNHFA